MRVLTPHATAGQKIDSPPGLQELTSAVTDSCNGIVKNLVNLFPKGSQGRRAVVANVVTSSMACKLSTIVSVAHSLVLNYEYVRRVIKLRAEPSRISSDNHRLHSSYTQIGQFEAQQILQFIRSESSIKSGQKARKYGETRYTEQTLSILYVKLRTQTFAMCLAEAHLDPQYAGAIPEDVTVHQANCWRALWRSQQAGFNMALHLAARFRQEYDDLLQGRESSKPYPTSTAEERSGGRFDPTSWTIVPRTWKTITRFLASYVPPDKEELAAQKRWKGISVLTETHPHTCPLCMEGPAHVNELEAVRNSLSNAPNDFDSLKVLAEFRALESKVAKYKRHLRQNEIQRENIRCKEQKCSKPGSQSGLMYRDYVSFYAPDGSKVRVLVFVLMKCEKPIYIYNIHWRADARGDVWTYRDALDHLAQRTSILDDLNVLYISGDHGPHFSCPKCFNYESDVFETSSTWGKRGGRGLDIKLEFLCSYHACNRCDGACMVVKIACWR